VLDGRHPLSLVVPLFVIAAAPPQVPHLVWPAGSFSFTESPALSPIPLLFHVRLLRSFSLEPLSYIFLVHWAAFVLVLTLGIGSYKAYHKLSHHPPRSTTAIAAPASPWYHCGLLASHSH